MADHRERLKALFEVAIELPAAARERFLNHSCDDPELRRELGRLLASHDRAGEFLERPGGLEAAATLMVESSPMIGQRFGPYRLLREIGAGGMGIVYLGTRDDAEYRKDVAVKVVRRDATTDLTLRRFRQERQILADLDHPNIARLLDGGTTAEGIPYLVMELVEGTPIDAYAERENLPVDARLQLFEQVCQAVGHAHQRGIVHRDLKPSNVLVSSSGSLKLLDFGIAKLLESEAGVTRESTATVGRMLTPQYASPEQVRGEPVTAASDIYSLGVLLYRLLSGRSPYRVAGDAPHDLARAICEQDPPKLTTEWRLRSEHRLSAQSRQMGGDVDAIICKAMRKRPTDRYASVEALAEDLRRYRARLPVRARRGTLVYRSGRFVSRHRAATTLAVLAAPVFVFLTAWSGELARRIQSTGGSRPVTLALLPLESVPPDSSEEYFVDGMTEALIGQLGTIPDVRVISRTSAIQYRRSSKSPTAIARELGADVLLEGEIHRSVDRVRMTLRMREGATGRMLWTDTRERTSREVLALHGEMVSAVASATNVTVGGQVRDRLSTVRAVDPDVYEAYLKGRYHWNQRTEGSLQRALQFYQQAVDLDPTYAPAHVGIADCYNQFGTLMVGTDSPRRFRPAATAAAIKALQIDPNMAEAHASLGYVKHYEWDWTGAERELKRAIELNPSYALARVWYANVLMSRLRFEDALREVILARELDPLSLAVNTNAGWVLSAAGHHEEAVKQLQKTLELDPNYAQAHWRLALAYANLGQFREAIREAETLVRLTDRAPSSLAMLARISVLARQDDRARRLLDELLATAKVRYVSPGAVASVYTLLNEKEAAFKWFERAYEERSNYLAFLAVGEYPMPDEIRSDPRFENLLRRTGLLTNE